MGRKREKISTSLIDQVGVIEPLKLAPATESIWIEVIQKMDSVYADLVCHQVELEQKNSALEEAYQFINSVLSAMTDLLIVCDTDGTILQVNSALERLTGKEEISFLGHSIDEVFVADSMTLIDQFTEKLGSETLDDCEVCIRCADGSSAPLAMNCSFRYDHEGRVIGLVLIGRPVGELRRAYDELNRAHKELKQTQQQLVHSEKMASLGRLVAGVAHELNNPISVVFGNMHALQRYGQRIIKYLGEVDAQLNSRSLQRLRSELKIDHIIDDITPLIEGSLEGAERVNDIVQELRNYSGAQKEGKERFDLPSVIRKAVEWVVTASRKKPEVAYQLPEKLEIRGHKRQLHQILVNLIQNSLDAMKQQTQSMLTVVCEVLGDQIVIQVIDRGPGIPEADIAHIFDPFYTSKPVGQGTGLGLYISYGLAQELGGDLSVENDPQGGVIFSLKLPLAIDD